MRLCRTAAIAQGYSVLLAETSARENASVQALGGEVQPVNFSPVAAFTLANPTRVLGCAVRAKPDGQPSKGLADEVLYVNPSDGLLPILRVAHKLRLT
jgi:hypothetical protein